MPNTLTEQRAQIRTLLGLLESTLVPETGLELFTVGDNFRYTTSQIEKQLLDLANSPQFREYIIEAPFGGGKTHLLRYLASLVNENVSDSTVISSLDMSQLSAPEDFEQRIVRGLRAGPNTFYGEVLRQSYDRIIYGLGEEYLKHNVNISSQDLTKIFETFLYFILGKVGPGVLNRSVLELLGDANPIRALVRALTGNTIAALAHQARLNSSQNSVIFVDSYIAIVKNRQAPLSRFDEASLVLAKEKELCNVVFRMLKLAGYKSVIVLVDELETVRRFDREVQKQMLTTIRDFRDRFSVVGQEHGFPSTALVVASTSEFSSGGELERLDPALQSRWRRKKIPLQPMGESDIDHLLFRLRDLFYLAGYSLKPLREGDIHQIIEMRREIFKRMPLADRNPRDVIAELIKMIKQEWII